MIKTYRRTDTIKAEQFDGSQKMVKKHHNSVYNENIDKYGGLGKSTPNEYIFKGIYIDIGDWIATGVSRDHWIIADDVFNKTYAELPVIPKAVSEYIEDAKASHYELLDAMTKWTLDQPVYDWIHDNSDTFACAWLDGYEIDNKS